MPLAVLRNWWFFAKERTKSGEYVFAVYRLPLARAMRQQSPLLRRTFIATSQVQADIVQDLYLRELKSYRSPPVKPSDSKGHVQEFTLPKAPPSPEEADIASELKAYESQVPEIEGQAEGGASKVEEDWFVEEAEEDETHAKH
ncbi:hypothetical protein B0A48_03949 [Cryoendolithus antarcticus]|uniref:ATP synthase subunit H, mitochondrial n=1 Tax=Cryoendolithus antarcticus TaxID=1507870 RepID=A0A1V8THD0_9PEZI|nr:hypothetical protein B0A48_03949 [Cryoendolithus antarcticus]